MPPGKLKMLFEVVQPYPVLPPDLMELFRWAQNTMPRLLRLSETIMLLFAGMKLEPIYISKGKAPTAKACRTPEACA